MIKVAMIGAGSVVFCKNLTCDILTYPAFRNATISYMDIDRDRLDVGAALCGKVARGLGASPRIEATRDLKEALAGADFVINMVQIGGFDSTLIDFEIPRKYGLRFTIADTTGPGGLFRALRTYPFLVQLCRAMEEVCPRALLLNYANPMSMNMQTITRNSEISAVGLCHSVQGTLNELAEYLGEKSEHISYVCAGINHMAFYLRLEKKGVDLYRRLFEAMNDPAVYGSNMVRFELMKRLGYFVTESSEHNAEYSAWFIPHGPMHAAKFNVPIDEYLRRCDNSAKEFERLRRTCKSDETVELRRSGEYGSAIIHAMVSGHSTVVHGNLPNRGAITNLPADAIVECATLVDRAGPRLTTVDELPPQLVGYINPHVTQHELFIRAALEGRRDYVYQAAMADPLTSAMAPADRIVDMCDEMIAAHGFAKDGGALPQLDARRTLVSAGAGEFSRADPADFRKQWNARQAESRQQYIRSWRVIGPFKAIDGVRRVLDTHVSVEEMTLAGDLGSADKSGLKWIDAIADEDGFINLDDVIGRTEWAVAYAYTEIMSRRERDVVLRMGSDDGIKVWLNGQVVHHHETGRAFRRDSDTAAGHLLAGINRIVVKIANYSGGWGFGLAVPTEQE